MNIKLAVVALIASVAMCCSESNGQDLLNRMLGRGGCDACASAPTCCDTPAPARGGGCGLKQRCGGCGLLSRDGGCDTGCDHCDAPRGLMAGQRCGGCGLLKGRRGSGCGCAAEPVSCQPAPVCEPAPICGPTCPDDMDDGCGCGLLGGGGKLFNGGLLGRLKGGGCNACQAEPAPACCEPAPVPSCGCEKRSEVRMQTSESRSHSTSAVGWLRLQSKSGRLRM